MNRLLLPALALGFSLGAHAGPGHDHGPETAAPTVTAPAQPRFATTTELFELVGVLDGKTLTLYLDEAATNAPITQAEIDLELAGTSHRAGAQPDGSFAIQLPQAPAAGVWPITATVSATVNATSATDLLAAELTVAADTHEHADEHSHKHNHFAEWLAAAVALLALAAGGVFWLRRRANARGAA
jgi:hypothetical protein